VVRLLRADVEGAALSGYHVREAIAGDVADLDLGLRGIGELCARRRRHEVAVDLPPHLHAVPRVDDEVGQAVPAHVGEL
jgi:hypothetical protein